MIKCAINADVAVYILWDDTKTKCVSLPKQVFNLIHEKEKQIVVLYENVENRFIIEIESFTNFYDAYYDNVNILQLHNSNEKTIFTWDYKSEINTLYIKRCSLNNG